MTASRVGRQDAAGRRRAVVVAAAAAAATFFEQDGRVARRRRIDVTTPTGQHRRSGRTETDAVRLLLYAVPVVVKASSIYRF